MMKKYFYIIIIDLLLYIYYMAELLLNGIILILDMAGNGDLNLMKEVMLWMRPDPNAQSITDKPSSSGNYNARLFTSEL